MLRFWLLSIWLVTTCCFATTYRVVVNHAPPYRIVQNGTYSGIYIDILKEAARESGMGLKFINVPFKRALNYMETGRADIMLGPNRTPERELFMDYIDAVPFPRENKAFFVAEPANNIYSYNDLYGKKVETLEGAVYFDRFDQDPKIIRCIARDYKSAMKRVSKGRSDVVIIPEKQGELLNKLLGLNLLKSDFIVKGKLSFITVSKQTKDKSLVEQLTNAMLAIQKKDIPEKILRQYKHQGEITNFSEQKK